MNAADPDNFEEGEAIVESRTIVLIGIVAMFVTTALYIVFGFAHDIYESSSLP